MTGILVCLYLLIGLWVGLDIDAEEMAEHVPYGDFPSMAPLPNIRRTVVILATVCWLPICMTAVMTVLSRAVRRTKA